MNYSSNVFRVGDKVQLVKDTGIRGFTLGKVYEVFEWMNRGDDPEWNSILNDFGSAKIVNHPKFQGCFIKVNVVDEDKALGEAVLELQKFFEAV